MEIGTKIMLSVSLTLFLLVWLMFRQAIKEGMATSDYPFYYFFGLRKGNYKKK